MRFSRSLIVKVGVIWLAGLAGLVLWRTSLVDDWHNADSYSMIRQLNAEWCAEKDIHVHEQTTVTIKAFDCMVPPGRERCFVTDGRTTVDATVRLHDLLGRLKVTRGAVPACAH